MRVERWKGKTEYLRNYRSLGIAGLLKHKWEASSMITNIQVTRTLTVLLRGLEFSPWIDFKKE